MRDFRRSQAQASSARGRSPLACAAAAPVSGWRIGSACRYDRQGRPLDEDDAVRAAARLQPGALEARERLLEVVALMPDLEDQNRLVAHARAGFGDDAPDEVHAVGAAGQRQARLGQVLRRQRRHARVVDVGRVAEDQVVGAAQCREEVGLDDADAIVEPVPADVDARERERRGRDVGSVDRDFRIDHRGDDGEAAVAGAQIEDAPCPLREPRVEAAGLLGVDEQLGDVGARHDGPLVDGEGDLLQPCFAGQVSGGKAALDAPADQRFRGRLLGRAHDLLAAGIERVERQAESPGHQPGGLVEGIAGAVPEGDAGLLQPFGLRDHQLDERHRSSCSSVDR
jgi:hypothetical protein